MLRIYDTRPRFFTECRTVHSTKRELIRLGTGGSNATAVTTRNLNEVWCPPFGYNNKSIAHGILYVASGERSPLLVALCIYRGTRAMPMAVSSCVVRA